MPSPIILAQANAYLCTPTTLRLSGTICYFLQYGDTPIHLASMYGHVEVIEKLISSGADVNVVDKVSVNY